MMNFPPANSAALDRQAAGERLLDIGVVMV
jgi:hypothetical protein